MSLKCYVESIIQRPPFRYIDECLHIDRCARSAHFVLDAGRNANRFGDSAGLQGFLLVEAMAQASGVLLRTLTHGDPGGYLIGLENARLPALGPTTRLVIDAVMTMVCPPLFTFQVHIHDDAACIAESQIQIMSKRELNAA